jgi:putative ABC transport system permease protein
LFTVLLLKNAILSLAPPDLPRLNEVRVGASALAFAFAFSVVAGFLFGLAPALQAANPSQIENLREGSRGTGFGRRHTRLSRLLVVSEVALSIILLAGAGLLLRSFWHVLEVHPGYNPSHLTTLQIWMPVSNNPDANPYAQEDKRAVFLQEIYRRVSVIPGVEQSSIAGNDTLPMNSGRNYSQFSIEGRAADSERSPTADIAVVDTQYFQTMEVPLLSGRNFLPTDTFKAQGVAVIDQTLAHRYWPEKDPIGAQIKFGFGAGIQGLTIVGVVGDIRSDGSDQPSVPHIYVAMGQFAPVNAVVFFRSHVAAEYLGDAVRREVAQVDPNVPVHSINGMDEIIARSMADRRFAIELLGIFASVALLLAAVGIYGVMAYSFSQRTREVGVRIALGAQRFDILRMAISEGMRVVVIGLACGLAGAAILTRLFRSMLFNVAPADPLTFLSVSAILASVALLACYIPAQRATRVDPLAALREE